MSALLQSAPAFTLAARQAASAGNTGLSLEGWLGMQHLNALRHTQALRPFESHEFGHHNAAPSAGHLEAANQLINELRGQLIRQMRDLHRASRAARASLQTRFIQHALRLKETTHDAVRAIEKVWDFYLGLFGQRRTRFGDWLVSCDRIALDCYQDYYINLGKSRSLPAPGPFSYMRTGFSPATFRRAIPLTALGKQKNPFPLVQLPYHRLVNPWTLGAVLHEVSHNLQNDLELETAVPRNIARRLLAAGFPADVAKIWAQWNRETFADLSGLLLGGPAVVASLMDVVGRSPESVTAFSAGGPHPTPYMRLFLSTALLRRMNFIDEARRHEHAWRRMYPRPESGTIPKAILQSFPQAVPVVVDAICFDKYDSLGPKSIAEIVRFGEKELRMMEEAAVRLAKGTDPGILPERFLIGAARIAVDRRLAPPESITHNFYQELSRR